MLVRLVLSGKEEAGGWVRSRAQASIDQEPEKFRIAKPGRDEAPKEALVEIQHHRPVLFCPAANLTGSP